MPTRRPEAPAAGAPAESGSAAKSPKVDRPEVGAPASGRHGNWLPFIAALVATLAVLFLAKNSIAKAAIESAARLTTGLTLRLSRLELSLGRTTVGVSDLRLHNPSGFPDPLMADLPEIFVDYNLTDLARGKVHLSEVRFHVREFAVIRNAAGELNINKLKAVQTQKPSAPQKAREPEAPKKAPEIQLDRFALRIDRVVFKDYSWGAEPRVLEFPIGLNEEFRNIRDPNQMVLIVISRVMMSTPIAALTSFDVASVKAGASEALATSHRLAGVLTDNLAAKASSLKEKLKLSFLEGGDSQQSK